MERKFIVTLKEGVFAKPDGTGVTNIINCDDVLCDSGTGHMLACIVDNKLLYFPQHNILGTFLNPDFQKEKPNL